MWSNILPYRIRSCSLDSFFKCKCKRHFEKFKKKSCDSLLNSHFEKFKIFQKKNTKKSNGASPWNKFPRESKARGDDDTSHVENFHHLKSCQKLLKQGEYRICWAVLDHDSLLINLEINRRTRETCPSERTKFKTESFSETLGRPDLMIAVHVCHYTRFTEQIRDFYYLTSTFEWHELAIKCRFSSMIFPNWAIFYVLLEFQFIKFYSQLQQFSFPRFWSFFAICEI